MELSPIDPDHDGQRESKWTVILLAGDRPGGDPLAQAFAVSSKSLVPIAGKPMLAHLVDTLATHPRIGEIVVLAQDPAALFAHPSLAIHQSHPRIRMVNSQSSIAASISATLRNSRCEWPVLVTTSDHVLLDGQMLDWFMEQANLCDVAVGFVSRDVARREHLDAGRTWIRFNDVHVTGANLFAIRSSRAFSALDYWQRLEMHRKRPWRMAWEIGPGVLARFLLRRLSLETAFLDVGTRLGLKARPVLIPFARAGVDVDKEADYRLVEGMFCAQ